MVVALESIVKVAPDNVKLVVYETLDHMQNIEPAIRTTRTKQWIKKEV